jgi:hypothetical protein
MNIHQLSVNYLQEQDRILVRINTTQDAELRLWFTRRLTLGLMPLLTKVVAQHVATQDALKSPGISPTATADPATQKLLSEFKQQALLQKSDFVTPFKDQAGLLPLGTEPLLVTEVNMTPLPSGQLRLVFNEKLPDATNAAKPRNFSLSLEPNLTHGFMHLLNKAIGVSLWQAAPADAGEDTMAASALYDAGEKPKYWN